MDRFKNQRGFAVVEVLLLVVVLGILGFVGYRAYQTRQTKPAETSSTTSVIPGGWKQYNYREYNSSFALPSDWKYTKEAGDSDGDASTELVSSAAKSLDYKEKAVGPGTRTEVTGGVRMEYTIRNNSEKDRVNESDLKSAAKAFGGTYGVFTAKGGAKGSWFEPLNGGEATGYHVEIYTSQYVFSWLFYLPFDENDKFVKEFKPTLEQFLKTAEVHK